MMKGSNNTQSSGQQFSSPSSSQFNPLYSMLGFMGFPMSKLPGYGQSGTGTKGSGAQQQQRGIAMPARPEYVNYQQSPMYNTQPAQPSQAILDFQASNYASGGAANDATSDDQIEAALRIVRLLGELNKKL
jgi:hypothetical protein